MYQKAAAWIISLLLLVSTLEAQVIPKGPVSVEAYDMPGYFLVCRNTTQSVRLVQGGNETQQGLWNIVQGLTGTGTVSFAPVALPDHYMRHRSFVLYADPAATDNLYLNDASFTPRPGLTNPNDPTLISFESLNYPGRFIIHGAPATTIGFRIDPISTDDERARATFRFVGYNPELASKPAPADKATDVPRDTILEWTAGQFAGTHDVYFGTDLDAVSTATRALPKGVLLSKGQAAPSFDPPGLLDWGQTYYWRIDEVNSTPDQTIFQGKVWTFTAEPYAYQIRPIAATASSSMNASTGPDKTIDGSGLNANDQHSTDVSAMWISRKDGPQPTWIQYEFDKVYKLHQMWVWNSNQPIEEIIGFGIMDAKIEVSIDGSTWTELPNIPQFAQATGMNDYLHNTTIDLNGALAKYLKITALSNWGGGTQYSLSEVRFFQVPTRAFNPTPASGATGIAVDATLNWRPGRDAVRHEVYLGTDPNALQLATTVTDHKVGLASLAAEYDRTYYWKVNEVNDAATPASWEGDLWSFSTLPYAVVDNFETYNDQCNRIFFTWIDGYGHSGSQDCAVPPSSGNGTGSTVGNLNPPFAERANVHSGSQAMPFWYDNTSGPGISETVRTFTPAQDWTTGSVKTLVLFFKGDVTNGPGQVYLKINGTKVNYPGNANDLATGLWNQWDVDLASLPGANLKAVSTLTIGVSGSGKGVLYVDDIRLYRAAPEPTLPTDPGTGALVAYYPFEGDAKDLSGKGYHGQLINDATFTDSMPQLGRALLLDGVNDYVELPIGNLISTLESITVCTWVNFDTTSSGSWVRIFDFGTGTDKYMFMTPRQGTTGAMRFAITIGSNTAESGMNGPRTLPAGWHHVAAVIDGAARTMRIYVDGEVVASGTTAVLPKDLGVTTQNWLGRSQWSGDGYYQGLIDDFRIYNKALSTSEIRYLGGDR
ncbi:MAG: AbfB domain-containing protein [Sedimentisphaerales bacterium]|nr:AbfB domain-containing protein [Sedimentisphaerales bacterium]